MGLIKRSPTRRKWRRRIGLGGALIAFLIGLGLLAKANGDEWIFFWPTRSVSATPAGFEDVWIESTDGVRLHGWFVRALDAQPGEVRPCIVQTHGNTGQLKDHASLTTWLSRHGFHVLTFDYRDYGRSDEASKETRDDLIADAKAAIRYAAARDDVDAERIGLHGFSLGAVLGLAAASESPEVRAVVAQAGFSRWQDVASHHAPIIGNWLIRPGREAVDSAAALGDRPLLVIHGDADEVVPVSHAKRIEDAALAAGVVAQRVIIEGMDHNGGFELPAEMTEPILAFFEANLGGEITSQSGSANSSPDSDQRP